MQRNCTLPRRDLKQDFHYSGHQKKKLWAGEFSEGRFLGRPAFGGGLFSDLFRGLRFRPFLREAFLRPFPRRDVLREPFYTSTPAGTPIAGLLRGSTGGASPAGRCGRHLHAADAYRYGSLQARVLAGPTGRDLYTTHYMNHSLHSIIHISAISVILYIT